jgi:NtrC-family two-component system sensor histidine kinase KinB
MDLRTRVLVGYGYLVSLIVVSAVAAALGFHHLGNRLSEVLEENFASVRWSMQMIEALERQDSALLAALLGDGEAARALDESEKTFLAALGRARSNVTEDREVDVIDRVDGAYATYRKARVRLLAEPHEHPLEAYRAEALPRFDEVKREVVELLDVNHAAMVRADEAARAAARRNAAGHGLVMVLALVSFAWLSRTLRRELLDRLGNLKVIAQAMAAGDQERRADATRADELGLLAGQLNEILDRQAELDGRMKARLAASSDLVLGLLGSLGEPAALLASDGRVVASTLPDDETARVRKGWRNKWSDVPGSGAEHRFSELSSGSRPVGWLATRRSADESA